MPNVLDQPRLSADSISGGGRSTPPYFSVFITGTAVTTPTSWESLAKEFPARLLFEGEVPDLRTVRAKMPMPSASDPSTENGLLWPGNSKVRQLDDCRDVEAF